MSQNAAGGRKLLQSVICILQSAFFILLFTIIYFLAGFLRRSAFAELGVENKKSDFSKPEATSFPNSGVEGFCGNHSTETNPFITEYYKN
jgi:hypothetical protein